MATDKEVAIVQYVSGVFGYHGGMGDPPSNEIILAIVRSVLEFLEQDLGKGL